MDEEDLENNPAPRLANAFARCFDIMMALASAAPHRDGGHPATQGAPSDAGAGATFASALSEPLWTRFCDTVPVGERKDNMLGALREFVSLSPLVELPHVHGPKQMLREAMAGARELEQALAAWDESVDPPASLTSIAFALLDRIRSAPMGDTP